MSAASDAVGGRPADVVDRRQAAPGASGARHCRERQPSAGRPTERRLERRAAAGRPASTRRRRPARRRRVPSVDDERRPPPPRSRSRGTPASRASRTRDARRRPRDRRHPQTRDQLAGPQVGAPVAEHESRDRRRPACPRRTRARPPRRAPAGSAAPSAAGEALTTLPHTVPAFWIWRPPIVRAAARRPSKRGRQRRPRQVGPGGRAPGSATRRRRRPRRGARAAP